MLVIGGVRWALFNRETRPPFRFLHGVTPTLLRRVSDSPRTTGVYWAVHLDLPADKIIDEARAELANLGWRDMGALGPRPYVAGRFWDDYGEIIEMRKGDLPLDDMAFQSYRDPWEAPPGDGVTIWLYLSRKATPIEMFFRRFGH